MGKFLEYIVSSNTVGGGRWRGKYFVSGREEEEENICIWRGNLLRCRGGKERRRKRVNMFRECKLDQVREILKSGVCIP